MTKILLIGQGIAGTLLAWTLRKKGVLVHVIDGNLAGRSTPAAAGIINPVTGKRFVKSWRFDEFYPFAKTVYQQLEQELGISIWEECPTIRLLGTAEEANDWASRCGQAEYAEQLSEISDAGAWGGFLKTGFQLGLIRQSARAKLPLLLSSFRETLRKEGVFFEKNIDYQAIDTLASDYDQIVFCEGWQATNNPFFPETPFRVSKGEALIIRFPGMNPATRPTEMLKKTVLVAPLGDGTFWAGSTYRWHFDDVIPGTEGREYLLGYLNEMFAAPFETVDQTAGIRPTMIDRRPVAERSKIHRNMFIFNGLGTKGALLAPFFAEQLAEEICNT